MIITISEIYSERMRQDNMTSDIRLNCQSSEANRFHAVAMVCHQVRCSQ
jgi:predicted DNA-binding ribbon-helix-helix protein